METIQIGRPIPFKTQDAILAFSLYLAGVPEPWPPTNVYDEDILRKLGYRGLTLEDAAKTALKKEQRGRVEYFFERTPELEHFLNAYKDQQEQLNSKSEDKDAGESLRNVMAKAAASEMDEREALLRIACVCLKMRIPFVNRWKAHGFLQVNDPGQAQKQADGRTLFPGFKLIPLNASADMKRKMGL